MDRPHVGSLSRRELESIGYLRRGGQMVGGELNNYRPPMRSPITMTQRAVSREHPVASQIAAFCINRGSRSQESAFGWYYCTAWYGTVLPVS